MHDSPKEINVSYETRTNILNALQDEEELFTSNLFDKAGKEIKLLIRNGLWNNFVRDILDISQCHEKYEKIKLERKFWRTPIQTPRFDIKSASANI